MLIIITINILVIHPDLDYHLQIDHHNNNHHFRLLNIVILNFSKINHFHIFVHLDVDRRPPPPPPQSYDHPSQPPSASSYGSQQHTNHYANVPPPGNQYRQQQAPYRPRPPSLMQAGDKRSYDSSYDPNNNNKRPRPS